MGIADLVAFNDRGNPVLAMEVKSKKGTNIKWAIAMRENLISKRYFGRPVQYFLLALPDIFYLWTQNDKAGPADSPDYIVTTSEIFDDYYLNLIEQADHEALEMIFYEWLKRLPFKDAQTSPPFITKSGLHDMLQNADIQYEVAL